MNDPVRGKGQTPGDEAQFHSSSPGPSVLMVLGMFHPIIGGAELQAQRLAGALSARGVSVEVVTSRQKGTADREKINGLPVVRVGVPGWLRLGRIKFYCLQTAVFLYILRCGHRFEVIHVHGAGYLAWAALAAARLLRLPILVKGLNSGHKFDLTELIETFRFGRIMASHLVHRVSMFIATTPAMAEAFIAAGVAAGRVTLIPNGVVSQGTSDPEPASAPHPYPVIGFVGSLYPSKNLPLLVEALARLKKDGLNFKLLLVGDGPERERLVKSAGNLDMEDRLEITGYVQDVENYLSRLDIFVLPSPAEGLSNALLEAMAAGLACVAMDIPANRAVLENGRNGLLVPLSAGVSGLAQELARLLESPDLRHRLGDQARETIRTGFSMDMVAQRYVQLYGSLSAGKNR
ncbi:MAG: glycosyltransferase family 4 protein [Deltaproteobacteria bacterium]|nr:glycosyltransferase family 4 protein [Deltaproteobacteria bacterium]MBF0509236.1 glycosyltransferase family 4 protein [Deltaproteobacteria bacterium]MBF0525992.1 glycosyltransferase family 4 protein [Deltaproteobacteria bacterium]